MEWVKHQLSQWRMKNVDDEVNLDLFLLLGGAIASRVVNVIVSGGRTVMRGKNEMNQQNNNSKPV